MPTRAPRTAFVLTLLLVSAAYAPARVWAQKGGLNIDAATIADLNAAFGSGALTSERLVEAYLARIDAYDKQGPPINAVLTLNPRARDEARAARADVRHGRPDGPQRL